MLKGEYAEAQQLLEKELLDLRNGQCYLPLGEMLIDYPSRGRCIAYERRLDLKSAVHTMEMKWQSVAGESPTAVRQECFVSAPDRCLVLHVETEAPMELQFSLLTPHRHESYVQNGVLIMDGCCPGTVNIERDSFDNEPGMGFRTVCAVKSDGHVRLSGSVITVNSQKTLTLILAAGSRKGWIRIPALLLVSYRF